MRVQMQADASQEATGSRPVERGFYTVKVLESEGGQTKTGKVMANLTLEIQGTGGRKMWHNVTFTPKGQPGHGFTVLALHAFGLEYDGSLDFDTDDFVGKSAEALVGVEPYAKKDGSIGTKNVIEQFYTENNPAPSELPAAPAARVAAAPRATVPASEDVSDVPF